MKLLEHKGKELLKACGIRIPPSIVVDNKDYVNLSYHKEQYKEFFFEHKEVVIKAQIIAGGRGKAGLIKLADKYKESLETIHELYKKKHNSIAIDTLLVEKKLAIAKEYFLSVVWDTRNRSPMIILSQYGGIDVEDMTDEHKPETLHVSILDGLYDYQARELATRAGFTGRKVLQIASLVKKIYACFVKYDCRICEINPLIETTDGLLYAGDAKITIDDSGVGRQTVFHEVTEIEDRSLLTPRALEARKIDYHDHRGVSGKTFVEFDGDIAVLASAGGVSIVTMDTLIEAGASPANYVEYSGNPPREKVRKLTKVTLENNPKLNALLIAGGTANFTDILDTLTGVVEGIEDLKELPDYPIIIRRSGPRKKEAFEMIEKWNAKHGLDITLYGEETALTKAALEIVEKAKEYKKTNDYYR